MLSKKCAIIGSGFVGATSAFALMQSGLFNEIVLLDSNQARAQGEAMDLNHGMPFAMPVNIHAGDYEDITGCALVVIAAGANQKPGETRLDLADKNITVFRGIIAEIIKRNTECVLLVVTNPVDVLTYAALKFSGFPRKQVIGSGTVLDTARLKYLVGEHFGVDSRNVHAYIIGEHGDTEVPLWSTANVAGIPVADFCARCKKCTDMQSLNDIFLQVKSSAYQIIQGKGATYYAVAMAVLRIAQALMRDENSVLTVSGYISGQYGVEDVCLGLPAVVGSGGIINHLDVPLSDEELRALHASAETIQAVIRGKF